MMYIGNVLFPISISSGTFLIADVCAIKNNIITTGHIILTIVKYVQGFSVCEVAMNNTRTAKNSKFGHLLIYGGLFFTT